MEFEDKRMWLKWLAVGCPMGREAEDCPVCEHRKMSLEEYIGYVDRMEMNKVEDIIEHHKTCLNKREGIYW